MPKNKNPAPIEVISYGLLVPDHVRAEAERQKRERDAERAQPRQSLTALYSKPGFVAVLGALSEGVFMKEIVVYDQEKEAISSRWEPLPQGAAVAAALIMSYVNRGKVLV